MLNLQNYFEDCRLLKTQSPVIHNITNSVAMNFTANALLAVGASPIMSSCPEEMEELAVLCNALVVNIGTITTEQMKAIEISAARMMELRKPWVLDPVGAGASRFRTKVSQDLINRFRPSIIRCNASEAAFLAEAFGVIPSAGESHGVDASEQLIDVETVAKALSLQTGSVVCISGKVDVVSDGERMEAIDGGHPLMAKVTATGCVGTALCGAFAAVCADFFTAVCEASFLEKKAGSAAASRCRGTGSFTVEFLDALWEETK